MSFDYSDLMRGEGEWRNMQDVIRRAFKHSFEKIEQQQEQINQLVSTVTVLKSQIAAKPTSQEVDDMVSFIGIVWFDLFYIINEYLCMCY